jgi:hypothetical protein
MANLWFANQLIQELPDAPLVLLREYASQLKVDTGGQFEAFVREEADEYAMKYGVFIRVPGLDNDYRLFRVRIDWDEPYPANIYRFDLRGKNVGSKLVKNVGEFKEYLETFIRARTSSATSRTSQR